MSEVTRDFNFRTDFIFVFFDVKNKQFRLITLFLHFFVVVIIIIIIIILNNNKK